MRERTCEQKGVALQPRHQLGRMRSLMGLPHVAQLQQGEGGARGKGQARFSTCIAGYGCPPGPFHNNERPEMTDASRRRKEVCQAQCTAAAPTTAAASAPVVQRSAAQPNLGRALNLQHAAPVHARCAWANAGIRRQCTSVKGSRWDVPKDKC